MGKGTRTAPMKPPHPIPLRKRRHRPAPGPRMARRRVTASRGTRRATTSSFRLAALVVAASVLFLLDGGTALAARHVFGHSVRGRDLTLVTRGARDASVEVLVVGCIHGNEAAGRAVISALRSSVLPRDVRLLLVPTLNPDGEAAATRQNAHGVDLNRNFARGWEASGQPWDTYYPGPRPFSEPETRAVRRLIRRRRPQITIWYHQHMNLVTKPKRHVRTARLYARDVGMRLRRLDRLPGTASRWQNAKWRGHVSFVVELPAGSLAGSTAARHAAAVVAAGRRWAHRST